LTGEGGVKNAKTNFSLEAIGRWGERLHGDSTKDSWDRVFPPGARLWRGLTSIALFVEYWGTGGGLCRPLFATCLREAGDALGDPALVSLAARYDELGREWSDLADAALPADVPAFRDARELYSRIGELTHGGADPVEVRAAWERLAELEQRAAAEFPLSASETDALRADLQARVRALYEGESAAHAALGRVLG
jgi:hypothetical protein